MNYFFSMDDLNASEGLIEYVERFFNWEYFIVEFALYGVKIAHIAIFHD